MSIHSGEEAEAALRYLEGRAVVPKKDHEDRRGVPPMKTSDMVLMPKHYGRFKIEPIHFIEENRLSPLQGKVVKYVVRYDAKNGLEDLYKARRCLDMLIKKVEGNPDWWAAPARATP
jgi:hypothetical protein